MATYQFDISGEVHRNLGQTLHQIEAVKLKEAEIVHFPECNLTGYAGLDIPEILYEDYSEVVAASDEVKKAVKTILSISYWERIIFQIKLKLNPIIGFISLIHRLALYRRPSYFNRFLKRIADGYVP